MKKIILLFVIVTSNLGKAQISDHTISEDWMLGLNMGLSTIKNKSMDSNDPLRKVGPYFSVGIDLAYYNFNPFRVRYLLKAKWTNDLGYKGYELIKGTGLDSRLDLTGITWHKLGLNVFANDNLCFGLGGSFSDYIVDIPAWEPNYGENPGAWEEPSGWHWTAGPCFFADYGLNDFIFSFLASYDVQYYHPKINNDYEALVQKVSGYEGPSFLNIDFTINHKLGVYFTLDKTIMIDNGPIQNQLSRTDLLIGYRF